MKKTYVALLAAALVLAQSLPGLAAGSTSANISVSGGGSAPTTSKSGSYRPMTNVDKVSPASNAGGAGTSGVNFVDIDLVKENFTVKTVEVIKTINAGTTPLYRAIGTPEMVGYAALAPVQVSQSEGTAVVAMYVPNLVQGLSNIQILYYSKADSKWVIVSPSAIDYAAKTVSVELENGTPFTVVYK